MLAPPLLPGGSAPFPTKNPGSNPALWMDLKNLPGAHHLIRAGGMVRGSVQSALVRFRYFTHRVTLVVYFSHLIHLGKPVLVAFNTFISWKYETRNCFPFLVLIVLLKLSNLTKILVLKSALMNLSFYLSMHYIKLECNASEPSNWSVRLNIKVWD